MLSARQNPLPKPLSRYGKLPLAVSCRLAKAEARSEGIAATQVRWPAWLVLLDHTSAVLAYAGNFPMTGCLLGVKSACKLCSLHNRSSVNRSMSDC